jgi:hypothetical protein
MVFEGCLDSNQECCRSKWALCVEDTANKFVAGFSERHRLSLLQKGTVQDTYLGMGYLKDDSPWL